MYFQSMTWVGHSLP